MRILQIESSKCKTPYIASTPMYNCYLTGQKSSALDLRLDDELYLKLELLDEEHECHGCHTGRDWTVYSIRVLGQV